MLQIWLALSATSDRPPRPILLFSYFIQQLFQRVDSEFKFKVNFIIAELAQGFLQVGWAHWGSNLAPSRWEWNTPSICPSYRLTRGGTDVCGRNTFWFNACPQGGESGGHVVLFLCVRHALVATAVFTVLDKPGNRGGGTDRGISTNNY